MCVDNGGRTLEPLVETGRELLAREFGCDTEEMAITRSQCITALQMVANGLLVHAITGGVRPTSESETVVAAMVRPRVYVCMCSSSRRSASGCG